MHYYQLVDSLETLLFSGEQLNRGTNCRWVHCTSSVVRSTIKCTRKWANNKE